MTKTIAEIIKEKKLVNTVKKEYPIIKYDSNNNNIYYENSNGSWTKSEYDSNNNKTYYENSNGYWYKSKYDSNSNETYSENSNGSWYKSEYDSKGNETYSEDSNGDWTKYEGNNNLEFKDGKYYLNGQETKEAEE